MKYSKKNNKKILTALAISFIVFIIPILVFILQNPQEIRQHAANTSSIYPANIEYDGNNSNHYGLYQQANLTNPNIAGVDVIMDWVDVEPQQGVFNWTPMDNEMAAWAQHGKKFTVIVRYIHELKNSTGSCSTAGQYLPSWEIARIPHLCRTGGAIIPNYFDATFLSDLKTYVSAIAQHIAASPYKNSLEYVRLGVGEAGEGYPCIGCSTADMQQLTSWGYSIPAWKTWQENIITSYKSIFSFATVIYPLGDSDIDPASGQQIQQEVGYFAAANGMGVGQQGLTNTPGFANSNIVKIMQYIRSHYPSAYTQFQTVQPLTDATQLQGDIQIANTAGAFSVEWYSQDSINAPYQQYFQQWQQMVDNKYGCSTNCPSPTPVRTKTPTPTPPSPSTTISPLPTATPNPHNTIFSLIICLHGLGNCGDNANPNGGNTSPSHTIRSIKLMVFNLQNNQVGQSVSGTAKYVSSANNFQGTIDMGNFPTGDYLIKIKSDGYLESQIPLVIHITAFQSNSIPEVYLVAGDINNDNQLDIKDYNALVGCFGLKINTPSCLYPPTSSAGADISDDGHVDGIDYNIFLRELSVQKGG